MFREGKVLQNKRSPVPNACRIGPYVTVRTIVVAACKFVGGRRSESEELEHIQVNIRNRNLEYLGSHSRRYFWPIERIPGWSLFVQRIPNRMPAS